MNRVREVLLRGKGSELAVEHLIGRVPDPERDRDALLRVANGSPAAAMLAEQLSTDQRRRHTPLGVMLPGLEGVGASRGPFPSPAGARAANCLLRAQITDWRALASWTPADIDGLVGIGQTTVEEILTAAIGGWADLHLEDSTAVDPEPIYQGLLTLSAWGTSTRGTRGAVAAIVAAAADPGRLPPRVARAMRALGQIGEADEASRGGLERALLELEATPGFTVFKRLRLDGSERRPTQTELAGELGVSRSRPGQMEASFRRALAQRMREPNWPIRLAVEHLREQLGAVARPRELDRTFTSLDPGGSLEPNTAHKHRRALLLLLCEYRLVGEWVLGPDIEGLTDIVLTAVAADGRAELRAASRQLTFLGVREELQLEWILSRSGFRILDDRIVNQSAS